MHVENTETGITGTITTLLLFIVSITSVESGFRIMASIATIVAACVTVYYTVKKNKVK